MTWRKEGETGSASGGWVGSACPSPLGGHRVSMTSLLVVASGLAQDNRPDGPPWLKWAFLAVWLALAPWIIYGLHQRGYFKRRR